MILLFKSAFSACNLVFSQQGVYGGRPSSVKITSSCVFCASGNKSCPAHSKTSAAWKCLFDCLKAPRQFVLNPREKLNLYRSSKGVIVHLLSNTVLCSN